jgi:regulator of cell morphogenesis and NO signaling
MPTATQSIREIVIAEPSAAAVLERFEINLCTQSDTDLAHACTELQLSVDQVLEKLADAELRAHGAFVPNLESYSMTRLIQHIVRTHHQTVRQELPRFVELSQKIATKHGVKAPEYRAVEQLLVELRNEMFAHLEKEEQILFPYIVQLEDAAETQAAAPAACFRSVGQPISMMLQEHDAAQAIVGQIRELTHGFTAPEWACSRNSAFHAGLAAFEADLTHHIHIENDLLFPRAIAAETQVNGRR